MVNEAASEARNAMRELAIGYAPASVRPALTALLDLDRLLGAILRSTREPLLGQMRLTWWHEALLALDRRPPPAEPVLMALGAQVVPRGVSGEMLAPMVDGWEALLAEPLDLGAVRSFAHARGATLFRAGATLLGADDEAVGTAGEGWALADLGGNLADADLTQRVRDIARDRLRVAFAGRWSRAARPLGALALLAQADLDGVPAASPRRVARLLRHRFSGR